jgi:small subunit ribosomal protein S4
VGRYTNSVCRICRRENLKLLLKGEHCYTDKCSLERRAYPPGQHRKERAKFSPYGTQLREKQKVKRMYGILEKQFYNYFRKAARQKGKTGENLLILLERRLDNMIYRLGLADSRNAARQLVRHGHLLLNGKKVNIPSCLVKAGDVVEVREKSKKMARLLESLESAPRRGVPSWLELDQGNLRGVVKALPKREDLTVPIQEQLIVEFYSR